MFFMFFGKEEVALKCVILIKNVCFCVFLIKKGVFYHKSPYDMDVVKMIKNIDYQGENDLFHVFCVFYVIFTIGIGF